MLSLGAINTPKVLMHSGIGDETELRSARSACAGASSAASASNFQDHVGLFTACGSTGCRLPPRNNMSEATMYWTMSDADVWPMGRAFICQAEVPHGIVRSGCPIQAPGSRAGHWPPASRIRKAAARCTLDGARTRTSPIRIDANTFGRTPQASSPRSPAWSVVREIGNSPALRPFVCREVMPGNLSGRDLENFVRDAATSYWHQCGTAKMGRDADSVVDASLRVYGMENLRVADASIMPRITTGNTMAPCVIIGERAAQLLIADQSS